MTFKNMVVALYAFAIRFIHGHSVVRIAVRRYQCSIFTRRGDDVLWNPVGSLL